MSLVPLNSFVTSAPSGDKRVDVFNLSKAGAVQIGNILCHYEKPNEEDIVECLRNAGLPPSSYPGVDIYDPRYNVQNSISIGRFDIAVEKKTIQANALLFPQMRVDFLIKETNPIVPGLIGGEQAEGNESGIAANTITEARLVKKISAKFSLRTQFLIRRLQMNIKRFHFKNRCHRRRMLLLTTCILSKETSKQAVNEDGKITLASLFNDPRGGVFSECVAKWILSA